MISSIMIYGIWVYTNIRQMKRLNKIGEFIPPYVYYLIKSTLR